MSFGMFGAAAALGISAFGSALGLAIAGQGTIGAWKRCYLNNKPAPFILLAFAGAPLTQTIYGFLLMNKMLTSKEGGFYGFTMSVFYNIYAKHKTYFDAVKDSYALTAD